MSARSNAFSGGDDLVIGNNNSGTRSGLSIVSHSAQDGGIYFSKGTSNDQVRGQIVYQHNSDGGYMRFYTNADERLRITEDGQLLHGNYSTDQGWAVFWNAASGGADKGTAGQDAAGDQGVNIRSDMGPTHLDLTGVDNYTLKLANQAYSGSGIANPQGTISKILFNTVTYNGWNSYGAICLDSQGTSAAKGDQFQVISDGTLWYGRILSAVDDAFDHTA